MVVPDMIFRRKGKIVNIGSISGLLSTPFSGAYCASKAALHAATDSLRFAGNLLLLTYCWFKQIIVMNIPFSQAGAKSIRDPSHMRSSRRDQIKHREQFHGNLQPYAGMEII